MAVGFERIIERSEMRSDGGGCQGVDVEMMARCEVTERREVGGRQEEDRRIAVC
jgi:hypothetical protein